MGSPFPETCSERIDAMVGVRAQWEMAENEATALGGRQWITSRCSGQWDHARAADYAGR